MKHLAARLLVYLRLYLCYFKLNLIKHLNYRVNFLIGLLINLSGSLALFYFYDIVFEKLGTLGSWDKSHAMLLVGSFIIVESLYVGISFHSLSFLPQLIVKGELDRYLIRPISIRLSLAVQEIDYGNILNGLLGVGLIVYYSSLRVISIAMILKFFTAIALGFFFLSNVLFFLMSLAFWLGRVDELRDMLAWIIELGSKPALVYPTVLKKVFYWVIPFFLIANVPTEFLTGERHSIIPFIGAVIPCLLLNQIVWKRGLKKYASASH